jgi:hypothetical protein
MGPVEDRVGRRRLPWPTRFRRRWQRGIAAQKVAFQKGFSLDPLPVGGGRRAALFGFCTPMNFGLRGRARGCLANTIFFSEARKKVVA